MAGADDGQFAIEDPMERRAHLRSAFMEHVQGCLNGAVLRLFTYDLSMDGCMIETGDASVVEGSIIELTLVPGTPTIGKVIWRKNRNAGIKFDTKLDPQLVATLVLRNASGQRHTEPVFTREARLKSSRQQRYSLPPA